MVQLFAIIDGKYDALRPVWDERASRDDRRLLLALAGATAGDANLLVKRSWCEMPGPLRSDIATGLKRFKVWAAKVGA